MLSRRSLTVGVALAAAGRMLPEMGYAQRAVVAGNVPENTIWLNANENPDGPPRAAIEAMIKVLPSAGRYHYQEFGDFYAALARSEGLERPQVLAGAGSSEVLHAAIDAFTSIDTPLIAMHPTFEGPIEVARAFGREVIRVPLASNYAADVKRLVAEAEKANGGLIYLCNPNNPTGAVTPKQDIAWLVENMPSTSVALIDEAYIHFGDTPALESALRHVREGRNVVVTRTFSKIYGMAGLRAGFACAPAGLIARMAPFRNNVISIVAVRAVLAAIADAPDFLPKRRDATIKLRNELCEWLRERGVEPIESHANFVMMDLGRDVRPVIAEMARRGVAPGRPFAPMDHFLRVSIGTDADMAKFREVFWSVYKA